MNAYPDDENISAPAPDEYGFTSSGSGMFAGSHHFTLAGGIFNNNTNNYVAAPTVPPDFRMIPMGDIDLHQELAVNRNSGIVGRHRPQNCVRRVYSATIGGRTSKATVAVYQGNGAENDWKRDTEMYMSVRHLNIIQVWASASHGNIHATVFHGDLVPLKEFLAPQSPIMTVYLYEYYTEEWEQVNDYFQSLWKKTLDDRDCMLWIRTSTGRLAVDLVPPDITFNLAFLYDRSVVAPLRQAATPLSVTEVIAIELLPVKLYHHICSLYLGKYRHDSISASATVHVGAVTSWPSEHRYEGHVEIASSSKLDVFYDGGWRISGAAGNLMGNGWTRYGADDVLSTEIRLEVYSYRREDWLSQANYAFSRLQITSNLEDYVRIASIDFRLTVGNARGGSPPGYLFLCSKEDFRTGPTSFRWPKYPAYWSLDPEGIQPLSTEEAEWLGFPSFQLRTNIHGRSWDASVYAGLYEFHRAKGFDPDSQDVARRLGYPLYELSRDVDPPFAHVDDFNEAEEAGEEEVDTDDVGVDAQSSLHKSGSKTWIFPPSRLLSIQPSPDNEGSDVEKGVVEDSTCVHSHEQQGPDADQELMDSGNTGTNHEVNLKPQTANDHPTDRWGLHSSHLRGFATQSGHGGGQHRY